MQDAPLQLRAEVGRERVAKVQMLRRNRPCGIGIENNEIRVGSFGQHSFLSFKAGKARGCRAHPCAQQLHGLGHTHLAFPHRRGHHRQCQSQAGDAAPGKVKAAFFFA